MKLIKWSEHQLKHQRHNVSQVADDVYVFYSKHDCAATMAKVIIQSSFRTVQSLSFTEVRSNLAKQANTHI